MDLGLTGKSVVVTGGSRGIGRAIALQFAAEGANVALCARGAEALEKTAKDVAAHGGETYTQVCDVSDAAALGRFLANARAKLGGVDILINNASGFGTSDDAAGWQTSFHVDVMGTVNGCHAVVPWMVEAGGGSIVHIASTAALEAPSPPPYSAMKAALISHSKNLAVALAPDNVRVNTVAPGSIEFPGGAWETIKNENRGVYDAMLSTIPFGRYGTAEEVADVVVFVASPRAFWITGACISVDGGQHKGNL